MKFSIRDLMVITVIVALDSSISSSSSIADDKPPSDFANPYWVVTDSYDGGGNTKSSVGTFIVLVNGKLHFVSPKDGMATYVLKPLRADVGERFEMLEDGVRFWSALLIRDRRKTTLFINQINPANGKVQVPEPKVDKCDETFVCTPISQAEAKARMAKYGAKP